MIPLAGRGSELDDCVSAWERARSAAPIEPGAKPTPLVVSPGDQTDAQVSTDGRWLVYTSNHEGRREIYLRSQGSSYRSL